MSKIQGKLKVLVVGDIGVDIFYHGTSIKLCDNVPVPIFKHDKESLVPAMSGLLAANVVSRGHEPILIGVCGEDGARFELEEALSIQGVNCAHLISHNHRHTTKREHFYIGTKLVLRVDQESLETIEKHFQDKIFAKVKKLLPDVDGVIIGNYFKGAIPEELSNAIYMIADNLVKPACDQDKVDSFFEWLAEIKKGAKLRECGQK